MSDVDRRMPWLARPRARLAEALARRRVTLGFVFGALVLWLAQPTVLTLLAGSGVACMGEALRIWAAGHLQKSRELTSSGPYRWFAHPLYVGSSIMGAGLAIASGRLVVVVLIAIYLGLTLTSAVKSEEAFLRKTFGDRYVRYRAGRANGDLARKASDSSASENIATDNRARRFSLSQALANREHRAAIGLAAAVLLLFLKATYNGMFWREGG